MESDWTTARRGAVDRALVMANGVCVRRGRDQSRPPRVDRLPGSCYGVGRSGGSRRMDSRRRRAAVRSRPEPRRDPSFSAAPPPRKRRLLSEHRSQPFCRAARPPSRGGAACRARLTGNGAARGEDAASSAPLRPAQRSARRGSHRRALRANAPGIASPNRGNPRDRPTHTAVCRYMGPGFVGADLCVCPYANHDARPSSNENRRHP